MGTGGHAKVVYEALMAGGVSANSVMLSDHQASQLDHFFKDLSVQTPEFPEGMQPELFHVAIGDNSIRFELTMQGIKNGWAGKAIVHPRADVSPSAKFESASFAAGGAIVAANARIGQGCILNHNSVTDHDCVIGDFCHIAPGAILGGGVQIGDLSLIGSGAVILPGMKIGRNAVVGAGSVVTKTMPDEAVWIGAEMAKQT
ncbi:MAG: NeuD/PglB/VioB family sugar acetyltransferase [Pseudomonadota bacterium]